MSQERIQRERRLRKQVLRGQEDAWSLWSEESLPTLFAYVLWRCGNLRDPAEEIVQETWLIAVKQIRWFDPELGTFSGWLRGIAAKVIQNYFRKLQARNGKASNLCPDSIPDAQSDAVIAREQAIRIAQALTELPKRYESVLRLKYLEQCSVKEIAEQWDESCKAIESLLTRARKAFRAVYETGESTNES